MRIVYDREDDALCIIDVTARVDGENILEEVVLENLAPPALRKSAA